MQGSFREFLTSINTRCCLLVLTTLVGATAQADIDIEVKGVDGAARQNVLAYLSFERYKTRDRLRIDTIERLHERVEREVKAALRPFGYYEPVVESTVEARPNGADWRVEIDIVPGRPVTLGKVDVRITGPRAGDPVFRDILEHLPLQEGSQLRHQAYEQLKSTLQRSAAGYGYLDARLARHELLVDPPNHTASVFIEFETGERYRFGATDIAQDVIRPELMRKYLRYREGQAYDAAELLRTQFALDDSQYFASVEVLPQPRDKATLTVPIRIAATPNRRSRWSFGVGYATDTEARGTIRWDNRLVNSYGHRFRAEFKLAQVSQKISGRYIWPIGDPALEKFELEGTWEHQILADLDTYNTEARAGITRVPHRWQRVFYTRLVNAITEDATTRTETWLVIPGVSVASVPKGYLGEPLFGRQLYAELRGSSTGLGAKTDYLQFMASGERVIDFARVWHLLLRAEFGTTWADDFDGVPGSERFFAGGDRSVRGFDFNDLSPVDANGEKTGGKHMAAGTVEVIRDLPKNLGIAVFVDAGNAFNSVSEGLEYSAGIGLRFRLPIATVGFDIAQALSVSGASPRLHINFSPKL
ncbi:MAG: autotransporter assembly complex family protein [Steroidobacteraceae bacterium]